MSGIYAFTGSVPCRDIIIDGINRLCSKGKELCGTAVNTEDKISLFKIHGSPKTLLEMAESINNEGCTGLAECANACRAKPSAITSVPCASEKLAVAVNGNVENFDELRRRLKVSFPVATDEDLLLALLSFAEGNGFLQKLKYTAELLTGAPSVVFITSEENAVYCRAGEYPLAVGIYENGCAVTSEMSALENGAKRYFILEKGESARITKERCAVYDEKLKRIKKPLLPVPEIKSFENDFGINEEIFCLPLAVKDTLSKLIKDNRLLLGSFAPSRRSVEKIERIIITGCGASYRAAMLGAYGIEQLCDIPCCAYPAGELRYSPAVFTKTTLLIAVSEKGENADAFSCMKRAEAFGAKALAVTSAPYSFLSKESDYTVSPCAEFSRADLSLRAFISGALTLNLTALYLGFSKEIISDIYYNVSLKMAEMLPGKISASIKPNSALNGLSERLKSSSRTVVTGLCADYALAAEAAEKLRSISGVNAISFNLAELENENSEYINSSDIIAFITSAELLEKALFRLRRLKALGADITIVTSTNLEEEISGFEKVVTFADSIPLFNWLSAVSCIYKAAANASLKEEESQDKTAV